MKSNTAFTSADILLPKDTDMERWAVVACDQYTSEPEYWAETDRIVGDKASALRLILPELYLNESGVDKRIGEIHRAMNDYLDRGVFSEYKDALIYVERTQDDGRVRSGIVGAVDLEQYNYSKGSQSQVRATEATVVERIPPRIRVREGAPLELPHIMILIDDENKTVIEPLEAAKDSMCKLYDFDLMQRGGRICGRLLNENDRKAVFAALDRLGDKKRFEEKYGAEGMGVLLYAMGDGNHSLATAKEYYERLKRENPGKDLSCHPARYALVEIVNLHSPALEFEAIHRVVKGVDEQKLLSYLKNALQLSENGSDSMQSFLWVSGGEQKRWYIAKALSKLTVGSLQTAIDEYAKENPCEIDYIHGAEVAKELAKIEGTVGFILPDMKKSELFPTVIFDGALPRKTFSMGHAWDKRYYIEARKIIE